MLEGQNAESQPWRRKRDITRDAAIAPIDHVLPPAVPGASATPLETSAGIAG